MRSLVYFKMIETTLNMELHYVDIVKFFGIKGKRNTPWVVLDTAENLDPVEGSHSCRIRESLRRVKGAEK